jgi:hypothetical protein
MTTITTITSNAVGKLNVSVKIPDHAIDGRKCPLRQMSKVHIFADIYLRAGSHEMNTFILALIRLNKGEITQEVINTKSGESLPTFLLSNNSLGIGGECE